MNNSIDKWISCAACVLALVMFCSMQRSAASFELALVIHIVSFVGLGLLYEVPEFILDLICVLKPPPAMSTNRLVSIFRVRFFLTHVAGPIFGVLTVASGMYLVFCGRHSLLEGWLFWIICLAAVFVSKGLFHHNPYIRLVLNRSQGGATAQELRLLIRSPRDVVLNLIELPGYIFILLADYFKPAWAVPFAGLLREMETAAPSSVWISIGLFVVVAVLTAWVSLHYFRKINC